MRILYSCNMRVVYFATGEYCILVFSLCPARPPERHTPKRGFRVDACIHMQWTSRRPPRDQRATQTTSSPSCRRKVPQRAHLRDRPLAPLPHGRQPQAAMDDPQQPGDFSSCGAPHGAPPSSNHSAARMSQFTLRNPCRLVASQGWVRRPDPTVEGKPHSGRV